MKGRAFGRRDLLRAAGATLLVPAFLREAFAAADITGPRLFILMQAVGTHQQTFWPDASGTSPILDPILSDASLREKTIILKGVNNQTIGLGNEHDRGFNSLWTGVKPVGTPEDCFGGGPSIDQVLRRALEPQVQFPTLNVGVLAADFAPKNGHRRSFSYLDPRQQLPTRIDPYRLYAMLFPETVDDSPDAALRRLALRQSVLDHVAADLSALSSRLGATERRKLDAHATALREYEMRLGAAANAESATCARPSPPVAGIDVMQEANVPVLTELMLDLVAMAFACNLTRIVTFQLGYCGHSWRYPWLGINRDSHEVAHADSPDGSNAGAGAIMTTISHWVAENVARFARKLDALPDSGSTTLDRTLVVWANENSTGVHGLTNLPIVLLGRAGGQLTRTGVLDEGAQSHYQLCTSVLNLMGVAAGGYGDDPASGPLRGLVSS
jgi:hypothetical protein